MDDIQKAQNAVNSLEEIVKELKELKDELGHTMSRVDFDASGFDYCSIQKAIYELNAIKKNLTEVYL